MHVITLGGNGFLGSHFVRLAVDAGHNVTVVDRSETPRHPHGKPFRYVQGGMERLIEDRRLLGSSDLLCHFAYSTVPATANADPVADLDQNVAPLIRLAIALLDVGRPRILYLSSGGAVYGPPEHVPIPESHRLRPMSAYGVSKVAAENYLRMFEMVGGLQPTIVRPSNPYGLDQGKVGLLGVISTFVDLLARGGTATIWGDGSIIRDYVHVQDVAALLLAAAERNVPGTYNCGSGAGVSLLEIVDMLEEEAGVRLAVAHQPARSFDPPAVVLDIRRAADAFGWRPSIPLRRGMRQLLSARGLIG